jgi:uncharacterized protein
VASRGHIYVDFDDVLCETAQALLDIAHRRFGTRVRFAEIVSFDIGVSFGLTAAQEGEVMDEMHHPATIAGLPPMRGAREALAHWAAAGYEVTVVTGRPPATAAASRAWLARHRMPHRDLVMVDKYGRGHPPVPGVACLSLDELAPFGFCLGVEDSPEMAAFVARTLKARAVLFDRPWNAAAALPDGVTRCRGWPEVLAAFPT